MSEKSIPKFRIVLHVYDALQALVLDSISKSRSVYGLSPSQYRIFARKMDGILADLKGLVGDIPGGQCTQSEDELRTAFLLLKEKYCPETTS